MPTMHGGSFSNASLRPNRLIFLRKAIFPSMGTAYDADRDPTPLVVRAGGRGGANTRGAPRMNRRTLLKLAATSSLLATRMPPTTSSADPASALTGTTRRRVRPNDPSWPSLAEWERLNHAVGGRLVKVESPLTACADKPDTPACQELLRNLRRPALRNAEHGVGRCLDIGAERLCGRRQDRGRCRRRGRCRPRAQAASRRQRRRAQLSRHVERAGLATDLDAVDGRDRAA
jgi:hypothetical protein